MKTFRIYGALCAAAAAGLGLFALGAAPAAKAKPAGKGNADMVERGRYLVATSACDDCHTPKKFTPNGEMQLDMTRRLAGYVDTKQKLQQPPPMGAWPVHANAELTAWAGPWGISFPRNLTPDTNTGIGSWSEETFVKAIRTGKHMGVSRPILPPMPWEVYRQMTDRDLKAIYAYLRTIPPISNATPEPVPPPTMAVAPKKPAAPAKK